MATPRETRAQKRAREQSIGSTPDPDDQPLPSSNTRSPASSPHKRARSAKSRATPSAAKRLSPIAEQRRSPTPAGGRSTTTKKVPLNDLNEDDNVGKKSRGRPRKRTAAVAEDAEDQLISDLFGDGESPAKKPRTTASKTGPGSTPARKTTSSSPQKKQQEQSSTAVVDNAPKQLANPAPVDTEEEEFESIEKQAEAQALLEQSSEKNNSTSVDYDDEESEDGHQRPDDDNTLALDRSLAESEEFTMVSLESLRQQQAAAADHSDPAMPQGSSRNTERTPRISKSPSAPPSVHPDPTRRSISRQSPAAVEAGVALQEAVGDEASQRAPAVPFDAFGSGTQRDLRHGLMVGEMLARDEPTAEGQAPPRNASSYDDMSWKPTTLPRQVGSTRSYDAAENQPLRPQSRLANYADFGDELQAQPRSDADAMDLDDDTNDLSALPSNSAKGPTAADSSKRIVPFNNAAPSPIPSISDFVSSDDRPSRGKLPRHWRREEFLYSDETETPESKKPEQSAKKSLLGFTSPGASFLDVAAKVPSIFGRHRSRGQKTPEKLPAQESKKRASDPTPIKSILSTPARRQSSPSKGVHWPAGKDLEDISGPAPAAPDFDSSGVESSSSELRSEDENEIDDVDDSEEEGIVDEELAEAPAEEAMPSSPPSSSENAEAISATAALSAAEAGPDQPQPEAQSLERSHDEASADAEADADDEAEARPAKRLRLRAGPHYWTPNHFLLLRHYLECHRNESGMTEEAPLGPAMNAACKADWDEIPAELREFVGRTKTVDRRCEQHPLRPSVSRMVSGLVSAMLPAGATPRTIDEIRAPGGSACRGADKCPAQAPSRRQYAHTYTESDVRVAWAFVVELGGLGLPLLAWLATREHVELLERSGKTIGPNEWPIACVGGRGRAQWMTGPVRDGDDGEVTRVREDWLGVPGHYGPRNAQFRFLMDRVAELWGEVM